MTFTVDALEDGARVATGLDDFGSPYYREGLERTVDAHLNSVRRKLAAAGVTDALVTVRGAGYRLADRPG